MIRKLSTLLAVLALGACATMDAAGELDYGDDAKANYELALEAKDSGRYLDALKYFEHVRNKFPYSAHAALAELGIADTNFAREKYLEAIEDYKTFLKLHPHHPKADYAELQIAMSHYEDIPSDFILFPPSSEKDQTAVRDARESFEDFMRKNPGSSYVPKAKEMLAEIKRRLAKHEMYVADFYLHRDRWRAAIGRLNKLLADYPGVGYDGEALLKLARSHLALDEKAEAKKALETLVRDHPDDPHRAEAEKLLKTLA